MTDEKRITDNERYSIRVGGTPVWMVKLYNCDPSKKRGDWHEGQEYLVPPLGAADNPMDVMESTARHLLHKQNKYEQENQGWLTLLKAEYEKALAEFKKTGYVSNPVNSNVKASRDIRVVLDPAQEAAAKAEQARRDLLARIGAAPVVDTKKAPVPVPMV